MHAKNLKKLRAEIFFSAIGICKSIYLFALFFFNKINYYETADF